MIAEGIEPHLDDIIKAHKGVPIHLPGPHLRRVIVADNAHVKGLSILKKIDLCSTGSFSSFYRTYLSQRTERTREGPLL